MAQVTNYSSEAIIVSWITAGGQRESMLLEPQNQTINKEIVAVKSDDATIFDRYMWWSLPSNTFETVVYDEGGFFFKNLTMHCFAPGAAQDPVTNDAPYKVISPTDPLHKDLDSAQLVPSTGLLTSPPPVMPARDGEYDNDGIFGNYIQTREFITVRLHLMPDPKLHRRNQADPTKPGIPVSIQVLRTEWKTTIRDMWNHSSVPPPSGQSKLVFDVEWVPYNQHSSVLVADWSTSTFKSIRDTFNRASMFRWVSDMDDQRPVSAHEYGHYLGLIDSYMYDGEVLHFEQEIKQAAKKNNVSVPLWSFEFWAANVSWIKDRAEERLANGQYPPNYLDLMESSGHGKIKQELIDAIAKRRPQKLQWAPRMWQHNPDVHVH